jgi:2-iminobutanoate/2-iminopropanoate deaminase
MPRKEIRAPGAPAIGPYSHAIDSEGLVFLSGQTPIDPATGALVHGGIAEQTRQAFANLFRVLASAGLTPDDVVKVNVYLTDMRDFAAMNAVYETQFQPPYPARTTIGVHELPLGASLKSR